MRRKHCEVLDPVEIGRILGAVNIGRMATVDAQGYPYITPVNFIFLDGCVYFHCAPEGEKLDNIARNPRVGFEADIPLAYLEVGFNPERSPCRAHQLYHSVVIRGTARIVPDGERKTAVLNTLVRKHEGDKEFPPVTPDTRGYKTCAVVEIRAERMTAKSDLAQNKPQDGYRLYIAESLARRGLPGDLEAVRRMGFTVEMNKNGGLKVTG